MLAARQSKETAAKNAPGKHYRKGLSLMRLADKFPTDDAARECEGRTAIRWRGVLRDSDRGIVMLGRSVNQDLWLPI
ncbi:MAG: hypothetical protein OXN96_08945 [Bryobacterales bacterium]|nr:hypothetical protein [Bryobacterales bacterium]MDE0620658.1 hypothetical protein [Bryobacterales bacterium]